MSLFRFSLREVKQRPVRTALTTLSVVIGVAAVVSVFIATKTTRLAQQQMFRAVAGNTSLEVVAEGGSGLDERIARELDQLPNVTAVPMMRRYTIMYFAGKKVRAQALGIDPQRDHLIRDLEVVQGRPVSSTGDLVVDATFAESMGVRVGDTVKLLTRSGLRESEVTGIVKPKGGVAVVQGGLLFMSLSNAQRRFRANGKIDSIQIVLDDGSSMDQVQQRIAQTLPLGLTVRPPLTRSQLAEETMMGTELVLLLATVFALVIAAFIIYNTFQMNVGERRRQLGILRAIGTTRRQILSLVLREGLLMGLIGTGLGSLLGLAGAELLARSTEKLLQIANPPIQVSLGPFVLAALFGLGVSFLGAIVPARRASLLSPAEAMRFVPSGEIEGTRNWTTFVGFLLIAASASVLACSIAGWLPIESAVVAAVVVLIGSVFLLPAVLATASRGVLFVLRRILGVEGRLAQQQLLRHRGRTALTIGVLFIAASTGVGLASTIMDNVRDVQQWYRATVVGDFFVRAMMPDMATGQSADMPAGLDEDIRRIPGIEGLDTVRFVNAKSDENSVVVVVREFTGQRQSYFDLVQGEADEVLVGLHEGSVVLGTVLAQRTGLGLGDQIPLETREGTKHLQIVGTTNDYIGGGLTIYMHRTIAKQLFDVEGVDAYIVQADDRRLHEVEVALKSLAAEHGLLLQSYAELVELINRRMNGVLGSLWALLVLGFVIAAFGLVNTLAMNILEQTRELGMLRVVAMTRHQVRRTILAQAVLMGLIGLVPGTIAGVAIAYLINLATLSTTGHAILFVIRPWLLLASFAGAFCIVLIAAWLPAERAARLKLTDALQYE